MLKLFTEYNDLVSNTIQYENTLIEAYPADN